MISMRIFLFMAHTISSSAAVSRSLRAPSSGREIHSDFVDGDDEAMTNTTDHGFHIMADSDEELPARRVNTLVNLDETTAALHTAVDERDLGRVTELLDTADVDILATDSEGLSVLHKSVAGTVFGGPGTSRESLSILRLLLAHDKITPEFVNLKGGTTDATALYFACSCKSSKEHSTSLTSYLTEYPPPDL